MIGCFNVIDNAAKVEWYSKSLPGNKPKWTHEEGRIDTWRPSGRVEDKREMASAQSLNGSSVDVKVSRSVFMSREDDED